MFTQPTTQLVQWQDFKVKSEVDIVLEIAHQKGWKDCEIFGHGDMITQPLESKGWKLIPADLYEYSIPAEGVDRVLKTINAGVRIKGVIIADDERKSAPPPAPARPSISLPSAIKGVIVTEDERKIAPPPAPARPSNITAIGWQNFYIYRYSTVWIDYGSFRYCSGAILVI